MSLEVQKSSLFGVGVSGLAQMAILKNRIFDIFMSQIMTFLDFRNSGWEKSFFRELGGRARVLVPENPKRRGGAGFFDLSNRLEGWVTKLRPVKVRQLSVFLLRNWDVRDLTITTFREPVGALSRDGFLS